MNTLKFKAFGEELKIRWENGFWVSPSTGTRYSKAADAAWDEIAELVAAGGEMMDELSAKEQKHVADVVNWVRAKAD